MKERLFVDCLRQTMEVSCIFYSQTYASECFQLISRSVIGVWYFIDPKLSLSEQLFDPTLRSAAFSHADVQD